MIETNVITNLVHNTVIPTNSLLLMMFGIALGTILVGFFIELGVGRIMRVEKRDR